MHDQDPSKQERSPCVIRTVGAPYRIVALLGCVCAAGLDVDAQTPAGDRKIVTEANKKDRQVVVFGDPLYGVVKSCDLKTASGSSSPDC